MVVVVVVVVLVVVLVGAHSVKRKVQNEIRISSQNGHSKIISCFFQKDNFGAILGSGIVPDAIVKDCKKPSSRSLPAHNCQWQLPVFLAISCFFSKN